MNIKVKDVVGDYCITWSDGDALYGLIRDSFERHEHTVLDFLGIKLFASPFFNSSIGTLFNDFSKEYILENLQFDNLSALGQSIVDQVIVNSSRLNKTIDYQKIFDEILNS